MFDVFKSLRQSAGQFLNVRKRQWTGAVQDGVARVKNAGAPDRFWIAVALHRFPLRLSAPEHIGLAGKPLIYLLTLLCTFAVSAQTNPPPASYVRLYVNDLPDQPLVTVTVTGASNVSCFTIEEDLPGAASVVSVSGDGVWLPSIGAIRWGPYFNTVATNVSYRLTGPAGSYPVNGGAWMDGEWNFSPEVTMVTVLPSGGGVVVPSEPPQVAIPVFTPASGASVPTNVIISCATTNAVIFYTLDGSLPTTNSLLYTNAVYLASAGTVRAVAFTNGWTPSVAAVAYYGPPAATANALVTRSVDTSSPAAPVVTFSVALGTNAACVAVTETLLTGLTATNVTAGGNYIASNNVVVWGPFLGTNAQALSYQAVGQPGTYSVQATWSVDGVGGGEVVTTNIVVASTSSNSVPTAPSQVAAPVFTPASGNNVPVILTISCATPGAVIYCTLDGSLPTRGSTLYSSPIYLASASTIRAVAFTNGWTPSAASVAYYGPPSVPANAQVTRSVDTSSPTAPVVTFSVVPGVGANCIAVTESLPPGVAATSVTAGGNYIASNNVVLWGPFFGTNTLFLSYVAAGQPGTYPVQATWSVDGVGGSETVATTLVVASASGGSGFPTAPPPEPMPILSPTVGSNLPVNVSISSGDPQAQIYFTTDGSLPTQNSMPYTTQLTFSVPTTLRAVAFRAGYLPSVAALGNYVAALPTNSLSLVRNIFGNGTFLPSVTLTATPLGSVNCYAVTETLTPGLTPSGLAADAVWDPVDNTISWGPYLDNQPRALKYELSGLAGTFPLSAQGSFDGYPATVTGATAVTLNPAYTGEPTNYTTCVTEPISYTVDINPGPGIFVDSASGTVYWGDGTQSEFTEPPVVTLQHLYPNPGTYTITTSANWMGHTLTLIVWGSFGTKTDTVQVLSSCGGPVITNQPSNQVVLAGATAQFAVGVSSYFPVSYQWYFNQTNPIVSPATFATLTLPNVTADAAGSYSVLITSAYGSTNSAVATLTVVTPLVTSAVRNGDGSVTLNFVGLPNATTRIWAAANLAPPAIWQPIFTNNSTEADGTWQFTDTNAIDFRERFYRFSTP